MGFPYLATMNPHAMQILLADDDKDDNYLFEKALKELSLNTNLTIVNDGEQLMRYLNGKHAALPSVLFLDLNMPRKNGFTCLEEIKQNEKLKALPVIIFSTSFDQTIADLLYKNGAYYYICKPADFSQLKKVVERALTLVTQGISLQPPKNKFLLSSLKTILL